jgi:hypothetical protein
MMIGGQAELFKGWGRSLRAEGCSEGCSQVEGRMDWGEGHCGGS